MNNQCPTEQQLSAYHDGELAIGDRAEMARHLAHHLAWCEACMRHLQQLRQMSGLVGSMSPDGLSQIAWHRLHAKLDEVMERGLVRWAWEVSAVAAAILLVSSVWLMRLSDSNSSNPGTTAAAGATAVVPPWVSVQASADTVQSETSTPAGAWYLADSRGASDGSP